MARKMGWRGLAGPGFRNKTGASRCTDQCDVAVALVTVPEAVGEPPETVKVPVGVKVMAPVGAMLTGPERFMVVVFATLTALACMEPVPVRVPPCGPETLKELLSTTTENPNRR